MRKTLDDWSIYLKDLLSIRNYLEERKKDYNAMTSIHKDSKINLRLSKKEVDTICKLLSTEANTIVNAEYERVIK